MYEVYLKRDELISHWSYSTHSETASAAMAFAALVDCVVLDGTNFVACIAHYRRVFAVHCFDGSIKNASKNWRGRIEKISWPCMPAV